MAGRYAGAVLTKWVGADQWPRVPGGGVGGRETSGRLYSGAEGEDLPSEVPAPPASRLLFVQPRVGGAGQGQGTAYRYASGVAIPDVVAYYREEMTRLGWRELSAYSRAYSEEYPGEILYFMKGSSRHCLISVSRSELEKATTVTVIVK